jgi:hypothetical protein
MTANNSIKADSERCLKAPLVFAQKSDEPLINWPSEAGGREERRSGVYRDHMVDITDARPMRNELSLDTQGFVIVNQTSSVTDYFQDEQLSQRYEPELKDLIKGLTGAERVIVFDHTRRIGHAGMRAAKAVREPVQLVHSDYTERSGPQKLRDFLPEEEAEKSLQKRFAIINVWRSMAGPVESSPLALCDAGSVNPSDLLTVERRARDRIGEIFYLAHNPEQRWFYFPGLKESEALVFKCFDSARDGRARMSPHTAFIDPDTPPEARPRQSIESRCLVLF